MGDIGGAAGTIFFQFVIGQILYAEQHGLKPWVHLNNVSHVIYDPAVHGGGGAGEAGVRLPQMIPVNATYVRQRPAGHMKDITPGPPDETVAQNNVPRDISLDGTGVWEHYFEPISDFVPGDQSCFQKWLVTMDLYLITPGIHGFADWAPKCWRYKYLPDYITKPHIPLTEWLEPQRAVAHRVVQQYIRFRPELQQAAAHVNPECRQDRRNNACLGLHIRQSDKAAGRTVLTTAQFLPYAQAFVVSGGKHIYVATDSHAVLEEIEATWPDSVKNKIRTVGNDIVRSSNTTAVFDIVGISHHRTNTEVLVDILALSLCQYMVHGLSAVSESSIWINYDLHVRSVNLEDPDHLTAAAFGALVQMDLQGQDEDLLPRPVRTNPWFEAWLALPNSDRQPTHHACDNVDGVLLISSVAKGASIGRAFFVSIINQLLYAEMYNLKPFIHLQLSAELIHDAKVHNNNHTTTTISFEMLHGMTATAIQNENDPRMIVPGEPHKAETSLVSKSFQLEGNGIWEAYLEPVSDFVPGDESCAGKPLIELQPDMVDPGLDSYTEWAVRSWRYDNVPKHLWNEQDKNNQKASRQKATSIVEKYFRFHSYIVERADIVNPVSPEKPCLGVHIRNIDKKGKHRTKVKIDLYIAYMQAFIRAGGEVIYLATDSRTALQHIFNEYPEIAKHIRSQGKYVVRSSKGRAREWSPHFVEEHHRVNSEALVDTLALSKCSFLLHSFSTLSEASIYLNPDLQANGLNLEDPRMSTDEFEVLVKKHLQQANPRRKDVKAKKEATTIVQSTFHNATMIERDVDRKCRSNAIVYLVQKTHSSYGRDSFSSLLKSLDLLNANYLSIGDHLDNVDLFLFHTGDFSSKDLLLLEKRLGPSFVGVVHLVDLSASPYWSRPKHHQNDNPEDWYAWPLFSEGYRKMIHWFAIGIWQFFEYLNKMDGCHYRYILRLDEDSFIHSPIRYDIFELMSSNSYSYGYRMCAYEMKVAQRMWKWWSNQRKDFVPQRKLDLEMCGFYNNFFVADLNFFRSPEVKAFLQFIDRQGHIYRRRLGDLMIHSMAVYAFAPPEYIYRFLDFTYEHKTSNQTNGCVVWGGIQAGYNDRNASAILEEFYNTEVVQHNCSLQSNFLGEKDLSPTYSHRNSQFQPKLSLHTITAGAVELPGKGPLSG